MTARAGTVYLVGAGPGDPGLITRRGLELIRSADVILYDRLVAPALLTEARSDAEIVFVGKRPGEVHSRQLVADALLLSKAREGHSVVRLKGGDPFVFGRGAEEARLLAETEVPFEIVPGVSSAIAVPAYAGIPVTERGVAASFAVLTARLEEGGLAVENLAVSADTLVLLMGVDALERVADALIAAGRDANEPAAVIQWGTTPQQQTVTGPLAEIAGRARAAGLGPPATTIVGRVVATRETISWFEQKPLFGRTIALTRAADRSGQLAAQLHELGAEVLIAPVIAVTDPSDAGLLESALKELDDYDWVILTSVTAVRRLFRALDAIGRDARAFARSKVAVVGLATEAVLRKHGLRADLVATGGTAMSLVGELPRHSGRVLWPRAESAPARPVEVLREQGWMVDEVPAYRTVPTQPPDDVVERIRAGECDAVAFTSASTVRNFTGIFGREVASALRCVCIGPETEGAARAEGLEVAAVADPHTAEGLVTALTTVLTGSR